jgi:hypothetical protein
MGLCDNGNELLVFIIMGSLSGKTLPQYVPCNLADILFFLYLLPQKIEHFITTAVRTSNPTPCGWAPTWPPF